MPSAIARAHRAVPQGEDHPRPSGAAHAGGGAAIRRRPGVLGVVAVSEHFLKLTPLNVAPANWGKATPETFFGALLKAYGANRVAWGSNFPATAGTLKEILGKAQEVLSFASAGDREWIFGKTALALYPSLKD